MTLHEGAEVGPLSFLLSAREFCKAVFSYEAQNEDELSIKEGDIVAIINKVSKHLFDIIICQLATDV